MFAGDDVCQGLQLGNTILIENGDNVILIIKRFMTGTKAFISQNHHSHHDPDEFKCTSLTTSVILVKAIRIP